MTALNAGPGRHEWRCKTKRALAQTLKGQAQLDRARASGRPFQTEVILSIFLWRAGFSPIIQKRIGSCIVDAWVPSHRLVFEADGRYWHGRRERENPGYHRCRDAYLLEYGVTAVIHLSDADLMAAREDLGMPPWTPYRDRNN
jgi:very-short-patch-repair endonuclease